MGLRGAQEENAMAHIPKSGPNRAEGGVRRREALSWLARRYYWRRSVSPNKQQHPAQCTINLPPSRTSHHSTSTTSPSPFISAGPAGGLAVATSDTTGLGRASDTLQAACSSRGREICVWREGVGEREGVLYFAARRHTQIGGRISFGGCRADQPPTCRKDERRN